MSSFTQPKVVTISEVIYRKSRTYEGAANLAKVFLQPCQFYWTNATFHPELQNKTSDDGSYRPPKSPLPSRDPPLSAFPGKKPLRVSEETKVWFTPENSNPESDPIPELAKLRPCYLAEYDESTNQGIIFLGTGTKPKYKHRFVLVHSGDSKSIAPQGSLMTEPGFSFKQSTYLNISHPLRVQFAYLQRHEISHTQNIIPNSDCRKPPPVGITEFNKVVSNFTPVVLTEGSKKLFWDRHVKYHRSKSHSDDIGDDSSGPSSGPGRGHRGRGRGHRGRGRGRHGRGTSGSGSSRGGGSGVSSEIATSIINTTGIGSSGGVKNVDHVSPYEDEFAPWGRIGDQRIGIDIPLVTEDICSDSDEEMDLDSGEKLEELETGFDANDAPWGRIGDQRIGIDIPLVTEDICSDSKEMEEESNEEVEDVANVVTQQTSIAQSETQPESSEVMDITTESNPRDKNSLESYVISKPYFVLNKWSRSGFVRGLLAYDHSACVWRWTRILEGGQVFLAMEGLYYEYIRRDNQLERVFNLHTNKSTKLPPTVEEIGNQGSIVGMIVDTSVRPYNFKVIKGNHMGTQIYDSTTNLWRMSRLSNTSGLPSMNDTMTTVVAYCKGIVFIRCRLDGTMIYDMDKDKWDFISDPSGCSYESNYGIGSWDDRLFLSSLDYTHKTIRIRELVDMAEQEWKEFDTMPREMSSWLFHPDYYLLEINVSYCSEKLLISAWYALNQDDFVKADRFVLYNLASKAWEKLVLPVVIWENPLEEGTSDTLMSKFLSLRSIPED